MSSLVSHASTPILSDQDPTLMTSFMFITTFFIKVLFIYTVMKISHEK